MKRFLLYSLLSIVSITGGGRVAVAQEQAGAWLSVRSNLPTSLVLVDSVYAGRAEGAFLPVSAGRRRVALVPAEVGAWDLPQPHRTIDIAPGDTIELQIDFPYQYRIDSVPFGATVSIQEDNPVKLGKTPLIHTSASVIREPLLLTKDGYASATIVPGSDVINRHSVVLVPMDQTASSDLAVEWNPRGSSSRWVNWAAAGLALGGGALAVHYKFKADAEYDDYLQTGDPETKELVDRYDRYSYFALGAMQVGIGVLVIRLAF